MISLIICSINKDLCEQLIKNIESTIGVEWEPVIKDNTILKQGITKVYNEAAQESRYDILCFVHEDVIFKTQGWGKYITSEFENNRQLGLIGIGGCKYKSAIPSGWFTGIKQLDCCNIEHINSKGESAHIYFNPDKSVSLQEVVVVDGVFMCCPKAVWENIKFDEHLLKGFHLYDIDFSIRVAQQFKAAVTFKIDLLHFTEGGNYGNEWIKYTLKWHKHMAHFLPYHTGDIKPDNSSFERIIVRNWLIRLKHERIKMVYKFSWLFHTKVWKYIHAWPNTLMFFLKQFIKSSKQ